MSRPKGVALITGASSGFGTEFARQLAPLCRCLILVARRHDRLELLKNELHAVDSDLEILCQVVDLSSTNEVDTLIGSLEQKGLQPDWLINNAGVGDYGNFFRAESAKVHQVLHVNMLALTALTHALLPAMLQRKSGYIINVGSIAGYLPLPGFATYAASKAYVNSFSEALHWEVFRDGVTVTAVCPGPVPTEFKQAAERKGSDHTFNSPKFVEIPVEQVVRQSLSAAQAGHPRVVPGLFIWLGSCILSKLPFWWLRLLYRCGAIRV